MTIKELYEAAKASDSENEPIYLPAMDDDGNLIFVLVHLAHIFHDGVLLTDGAVYGKITTE